MKAKSNEERLEHWKSILESCQSRPEGQTIASWCKQNGISPDQYHYWRRRVRKKTDLSVPAVQPSKECEFQSVAFVEIPQLRKESVSKTQNLSNFRPDAVIQIGSLVIGIGNGLSESHLDLILREVANAGRSL